MKSTKLYYYIRKTGALFFNLLFFFSTYAQAPSGVPYGDPEPVEWDLFNIILLIAIPVIILIFYFKRKRNKKK